MAFGSNATLQIMSSSYLNFQDIYMEEGQLDISVLSLEEANSSLLLIHIILYHTSTDHVHTWGWITSLGNLLCTHFHVLPKHFTIPKIFPFLSPLPTLWEHNVCHKIQCHGLRPISAGKFLWVGGDKEDRTIIWVRFVGACWKGILNWREDFKEELRIRFRIVE